MTITALVGEFEPGTLAEGMGQQFAYTEDTDKRLEFGVCNA